MEAVGAAGSVLSIIGFAGQILQGLTFLCGFFGDIHDAPDDIGALVNELKALELIVNRINVIIAQTGSSASSIALTPSSLNPPASVGELKPTLDLCQFWVSKLRSLIVRYEPTGKPSKARKGWNNFNVAFRNKKFLKYTDGLQRAKSSLLQCYLVFPSSKILDHVTSNDSTSTHLLNELSLLDQRQNSHTIILTKAENSISIMDQNVQAMRSGLSSLLAQVDMQRLARVLKPAMEDVISRQIRSEFEQNHEKHSNNKFQDQASNTTPCQSTESHEDSSRSQQEAETQLESETQQKAKTQTFTLFLRAESKQRRYLKISTYNFWFGKLLMTTESCNMDASSQSLRTEVVLLPATWLLRKGASITINRIILAYAKPVVTYSIRPWSVLPDHNPIFSAILDGDTQQVQRLFANGTASPFDHATDGSNLLLFIFRAILAMTLKFVQTICRQEHNCTAVKGSDILPLLKPLIDLATSLIALGVDSGAHADNGWSVSSFL